MTSKLDSLTVKIENDPSNAWLYCERGRLYCQTHQWKLAIEDFTRAIARKPAEPEFWRRRGRVHEILGYVGLSREDLSRAVALDPGDAESYDARGWCSGLNHEYERAVADFDRAVGLEPDEPWYRYRRGLVLLKMDRPGSALEDIDEAIRLDPEEARYYFERARARLYYGLGGRPEEALPDLEDAIRLDPSAVWYRTDRGYVRFYLGLWAEAAEDLSCQDIPHRYRFCPYLGAELVAWIYLARLFQGEHAAGLAAVKEYLGWYEAACPSRADAKSSPEWWYWPVPLVRFLAGEIDERQLRETPSLDPNEPDLVPCEVEVVHERIRECHFVLAQLSLARGHRAEALLHLEKASGLPSQNPMSWVIARQITSCG
jgi:lipoprotein NlpI